MSANPNEIKKSIDSVSSNFHVDVDSNSSNVHIDSASSNFHIDSNSSNVHIDSATVPAITNGSESPNLPNPVQVQDSINLTMTVPNKPEMLSKDVDLAIKRILELKISNNKMLSSNLDSATPGKPIILSANNNNNNVSNSPKEPKASPSKP